MNQDKFEDIQSEACDLEDLPALVLSHIRNAYGCETPEDLIANLKEAAIEAECLLDDIRKLYKKAKAK